jgi:hypothetical protein
VKGYIQDRFHSRSEESDEGASDFASILSSQETTSGQNFPKWNQPETKLPKTTRMEYVEFYEEPKFENNAIDPRGARMGAPRFS